MTRLAIAIPTFNRAAMLDAVLTAYAPTCDELGVPIVISDNASSDDTAEVCKRWASRIGALHYHRHIATVPVGRNIMTAIGASPADYTWFAGDDDFLIPERIRDVHALLSSESPSAVVVQTIEVPCPDYANLTRPLADQLLPLVRATSAGAFEYDDPGVFFEARHVKLPAPSVIYETRSTMDTQFERYIPTHHPHIGALFDALAKAYDTTGSVKVIELPQVHSVSLTVHDARGKKNWADIFHFLAVEGFPMWFSMLPSIYAPYLPNALAFHRHIFRAAFEDQEIGSRRNGARGEP